jgi:hypothetical protein
MTLAEYFYRFGLALGIGLLIGVQREAVADESEGKLSAGARTFALISLAGYVLAVALDVATRATVIAAMANTLFKGGFALSVGGPQLRRYLWPGMVLILVAGTAAALLI